MHADVLAELLERAAVEGYAVHPSDDLDEDSLDALARDDAVPVERVGNTCRAKYYITNYDEARACARRMGADVSWI